MTARRAARQAVRHRVRTEKLGGGGSSYGQVRELADIIRPGAGLGGLLRGGRGGGPLAEPGSYTVTVELGDKTLTRKLIVERHGTPTENSSPFEDEWEELLNAPGRR